MRENSLVNVAGKRHRALTVVANTHTHTHIQHTHTHRSAYMYCKLARAVCVCLRANRMNNLLDVHTPAHKPMALYCC